MAGAFLDRASPPGRAELVGVLGDRVRLWDRIAAAIEATYGVEGEPWFFGRESGWATRYRKGGRALVVLLPAPGALSAIVVVGPTAYPAANDLELEPPVRAALESAHPYPEGRWVRIEVTSEAIADDVIRLVAVKAPPPKRARIAARAVAD